MTRQEKLRRKIEKRKHIMDAIMEGIRRGDRNAVKEYDRALSILVELNKNFNIIYK